MPPRAPLYYGGTLKLLLTAQDSTDPILTFRAMDVSHGFISELQDDAFGCIEKSYSSLGGLTLRGFGPNLAGNKGGVLTLEGVGSAGDTAVSSSGRGIVEIIAAEHGGDNTWDNIGNDVNIFGLRKRLLDGTLETVFLVDEDGDAWFAGNVQAASTRPLAQMIIVSATTATGSYPAGTIWVTY
jgi:hypothetical protein